jgi:hypothetical protein
MVTRAETAYYFTKHRQQCKQDNAGNKLGIRREMCHKPTHGIGYLKAVLVLPVNARLFVRVPQTCVSVCRQIQIGDTETQILGLARLHSNGSPLFVRVDVWYIYYAHLHASNKWVRVVVMLQTCILKLLRSNFVWFVVYPYWEFPCPFSVSPRDYHNSSLSSDNVQYSPSEMLSAKCKVKVKLLLQLIN